MRNRNAGSNHPTVTVYYFAGELAWAGALTTSKARSAAAQLASAASLSANAMRNPSVGGSEFGADMAQWSRTSPA